MDMLTTDKKKKLGIEWFAATTEVGCEQTNEVIRLQKPKAANHSNFILTEILSDTHLTQNEKQLLNSIVLSVPYPTMPRQSIYDALASLERKGYTTNVNGSWTSTKSYDWKKYMFIDQTIAALDKLSFVEKLIASKILGFQSNGKSAIIKRSTLARLFGCSLSTIQRALNNLYKFNILNRFKRFRQSAGQAFRVANRYIVNTINVFFTQIKRFNGLHSFFNKKKWNLRLVTYNNKLNKFLLTMCNELMCEGRNKKRNLEKEIERNIRSEYRMTWGFAA